MADTHTDPQRTADSWRMQLEILRNSICRVGWSRARVSAIAGALSDGDTALSFNDGFSMSLGLYPRDALPGVYRIGGFMGLSDLVPRARTPLQSYVRRAISAALKNLDHVFFFGEPDRKQATSVYGLDPAQTSLFDFGVDTAYWTPDRDAATEDFVLSVGSDPSRDYASLVSAPSSGQIRVVTRLPVSVPKDRHDIKVSAGSFYANGISDDALRHLYRTALAVVVPVHDVWQPSGQSVTFQAMACGRAVIATRNKGFCRPDLLVDGENCLLVPCGNPEALGNAIRQLRANPELGDRLGRAGYETIRNHFSLEHMNKSAARLSAMRTTAGA